MKNGGREGRDRVESMERVLGPMGRDGDRHKGRGWMPGGHGGDRATVVVGSGVSGGVDGGNLERVKDDNVEEGT